MQAHLKKKTLFSALCLALGSGFGIGPGVAHASGAEPALREAAQKAIAGNPEVSARLNALRASANEIDVARGGLYPRVDLSASVGRDSDRIEGRVPKESDSLTRNGVALSLNQLLWDGRSTYREVERLGHARLVRWFEFTDATEQAALEAARAYYDVLRYRRLVELAEDNYVQHKYVLDQLQSRVKAGVGRGVDLEQARARLSLAESNLTTELANLHDVSARYERIVGDAPPAGARSGEPLKAGIVAAREEAVRQALARNTSISAAVENLRAARAQAAAKEGEAYQPKVEARVRTGAGKNFDGIENQKRDTAAEILLTWNLYNGGSDRARVRQLADLVNQAADQRDKACRDVRQTATIAHNDLSKLGSQLEQLDRNVLAIQKTRDAYRQQFEIGQRNLLDLLNAENELYTAKRSYANAESDLNVAYARTHAASHSLVQALGISRPTDEDSAQAAQGWDAAADSAQRCPVAALDVPSLDKAALDARAAAMQSAPRGTPVAAAALPEGKPLAATASDLAPSVRDWAAAWSAKDLDRYVGFYSPTFAGSKRTRDQWLADRKRLIGKPGPIQVQVDRIQSRAISNELVETRFAQTYSSQNFRDRTDKVLTWKRESGKWVIVEESNR